MPETPSSPSGREQRLERVLADYLHAFEAGLPPAREELLAAHPDLAAELASFFANRDQLQRLTEPLLAGERPAANPAERPALPVGALVRYFGDYELLDQIARGGMGIVYKARQISLNRVVALKMILSGQLASPTDVERFHREAAAAADLDHPHIVPIYEVGQHEGQHYFSMKLVEGGNLAGMVPELVASPRTTARLLATVARAVHHAHQRGILHRDVKPANILLDALKQPHVTDFGLARRVEGDPQLTQSGAVVGTPPYMAPEQARAARDLSTAADVYSLGAVLYECLTGQPPFRGPTPLDTLLHVLEREPEPPRRLNPAADPDLATIALKCLEKEPPRRYDSAAALADDLERWLRHEPILARPSTTRERMAKWARRQPAVAALLAAVFLVTVLGVAGIVWQWRRAEDRAEGERIAREAEARRADAEAQAKEEKRVALEEAEHNLYLQGIAVARQAFADGNVVGLRAQLELCPERLRGWEWSYLRRLCHLELSTLTLPDSVTSLACTPDGHSLAAFTSRGEVRVLEVTTGTERYHISPKRREALWAGHIAYSPDGKLLAVAVIPSVIPKTLDQAVKRFISLGKTPSILRLFEAATGREVRLLKGEMPALEGLCFSPDGKHLAAGCGDGKVRLWDVTTGEPARTLQGHEDAVKAVAFRPGGEHLASVTDVGSEKRALKVWDLRTGKEAFVPEGNPVGGPCVAYSPNGTLLAVADRSQVVKVLDAENGRLLHTLTGHMDVLTAVAFSPDGRRLASASADRTVRWWDPWTGALVSVLRGHTEAIKDLVFSPDARLLATASGREVKFWDATRDDHEALKLLPFATQEGMLRAGGPLQTPRVAFSADGRQIMVVIGASPLTTWDTRTGARVHLVEEQGPLLHAAFSPDRRLVAFVGLPTSPPKELEKSGFPTEGRPFDILRWVARPGSLSLMASLCKVSLADAATGKAVRALEDPGPITVGAFNLFSGPAWLLAFSRDGAFLAGATNRTVKVWEVSTGRKRLTLTGHAALVTRVTFSANGRWLATACDAVPTAVEPKPGKRQVKVWDLQSGREHISLGIKEGIAFPLTFSPDSRFLAGPGPDGGMALWDVAANRLLHRLPESGEAAFSPDSALLATAGSGGTIRLLKTTTGRPLHELRGHTRNVVSLAFTPDGRRLASAVSPVNRFQSQGQDPGELKLWDVAGGREVLSLNGVGRLVFSPDGKRLAALSRGGAVKVWDAEVPAKENSQRRHADWSRAGTSWHEEQAALAAEAKATFAQIFHLGRLIAAEPNNATHHASRALAYLAQEDWEKVRKDLTRALKLSPRNADAADWYGTRGVASLRLEDFAPAVADLTEALRLQPNNLNPLAARGQAYLGLKQWNKAVEDFTKKLKGDPKDADTLANRGEAQGALGQWDQAIADLKRAAELKSESFTIRDRLALAYLGKGDLVRYRKTCADLVERAESSDDPQEAGHAAAFACARVPDAVIDPARVLELAFKAQPPRPVREGLPADKRAEDLLLVGAALYRAGMYAAALSRLREAEKFRGDKGNGLDSLFLAMTYARMGRWEEAKKALARAIRLCDEAQRKGSLTWEQRLNRTVLRREAEALLKKTGNGKE
jgi:WD40 repeat protein/tetratricopeptide (TPR) repeat protein